MYSGTASSCSPNTLLITHVVAGFIDLGPANIHTRAFLHPCELPHRNQASRIVALVLCL